MYIVRSVRHQPSHPLLPIPPYLLQSIVLTIWSSHSSHVVNLSTFCLYRHPCRFFVFSMTGGCVGCVPVSPSIHYPHRVLRKRLQITPHGAFGHGSHDVMMVGLLPALASSVSKITIQVMPCICNRLAHV